MKLNILVLSATASAINYKNSLLSNPDISLFLTDASPYAAGLYAKGVHPLIIPVARDLEKYQNALDNIISKYKIDVLIPTSDHDMEGIANLKKGGWKPDVLMFDFDPDKLLLYTHKAKLMERLRELEIEIPTIYRQKTEHKYPMIIKPAREGGSKGVWTVHNDEDYAEKYELVRKQYGDDIVCQKYIPGGTGSIYVVLLLYGNNGKIFGEIASKSTLTFMTWGGGGNAGEIVNEPSLIEEAKKIIAKLGGWKGPINLEFKKSTEDGKFYLMEINCRLNGYSYLTTMNGLNFPQAIVDLLIKGDTWKLNYENIKKHSNFLTTFRELPVESWISSKLPNE